MRKYEVTYKKPLWAILISIIVFILIGTVILNVAREESWILVIIEALVNAFPFGPLLQKIMAKGIEVFTGVTPLFNVANRNINYFHEFIKLLISAVFLDFFDAACKMLLHTDADTRPKTRLKNFVCKCIAVILSTLAAGIIHRLIESSLGYGWSLTIEIVICIAVVVAGIFIFLSRFSVKESLLWGLAKYILVNALIVELYGFFLLVIFGSIQEGLAFKWMMLYGGTALLFLGIIVALSLMLDSVEPSPKVKVRRIR